MDCSPTLREWRNATAAEHRLGAVAASVLCDDVAGPRGSSRALDAPMAHLFTFSSKQFRQADERPNPINPIAGEGVLKWLAGQLTAQGYACDPPDAEDWGWYTSLTTAGRTYLLGTSGDWSPSDAATEWTVQLVLNRSLWNKVLGANRMQPSDAVSAAIELILRNNPEVINLEVDRGA